MNELRSYAGRFVLPLALFAAAVVAWLIAGQLASVERAHATETAATLQSPLVSVRRLPEFATTATQADAVNAALAALPQDPGGLSCVSIYVDGEPVLQRRSDRGLVPSYAQLLITGHAAIDILGPDYRYETQVFAEDLPDLNGRIFGGIYLVGGGDPGLMTYLYSRAFRPLRTTRTAIEELASGVAAADVLRIDGGVIAVERRFDDLRSLPGWPAEYLTEGVIGPLSALQLDDGFLERAAANGGVAVPSDEPATMAAERFADLLWDIDVQVFGEYRTLDIDEELPDLVPVARVFSPPLRDIVLQTLAVNDATAGELLLKELGLASRDEGTTQAGGQAVQQVLADHGVVVPVPFRDGSGLDPFGGTSCDQLALAADTIADGHPTLDALPRYNLPGVFGGAFVEIELTSDLRLVGGVHGEASGLVGRTVDQGRRVTIASIINRPGGPSETDLAFQRGVVGLVDQVRTSISVTGITVDD